MDSGLSIVLSGARALVTGGSRGLGRATALLFGRAGAHVGIGYQSRRAEAEAVVTEIRAGGGQAWAESADLAAPEGARKLLARVSREWDGGMELLVANAGVWPPEDVPLERMSDEQWTTTLQTNLTGIFLLLRDAIPRIADGGSIVLVASTAAQRGEAFHSDYAASKGALVSLTKSLAVELAPRGVRVNCVAPGWIDTEMVTGALKGDARRSIEQAIPLGRVASAEDVAGPILFLCSPLARHITGEVLNVNGGSVLCG